jgi:hypothetical protein
MKTRWLDTRACYDGSQLRAHWILREAGLCGDALVAFRAPCRVTRAEMADLADLDGPGIAGDDMVHFVWEAFDEAPLSAAVVRQRLFACICREALEALGAAQPIRRDGDDLYVADRKLSISIATRSPVSTLIHFAVNVTTAGTPVPTASLADLGVDPRAFADEVLARAAVEHEGILAARAKVRAKGEA